MIIETVRLSSAMGCSRSDLVAVDRLTGIVFVFIVCLFSAVDLYIGDVPFPMGEVRTLKLGMLNLKRLVIIFQYQR